MDNAEGLPTRARPTINSVAKFGGASSAIVAQKVARPEYLEPNTDHRVGVVIVAVIVWPRVVTVIVRPVGRCDDHCRWGRNFGDDRRANHWRAGCVAAASAHLLGSHHDTIAHALLTKRD